MEIDIFICHASEDKKDIAFPLKKELEKQGINVWYDETSSQLGDSFNKVINDAIKQTRFALVIFSKSFFVKDYPQKELAAFIDKEKEGQRVILPIIHNISQDELKNHWPTLGDRRTISSSEGLDQVVKRVLQVVTTELSPYSREIRRIWGNNEIMCKIKENKRMYVVFEKIVKALDLVTQPYIWQKKPPFYAEDYKIILEASISFFNAAKFPTKLFSLPTNEVDCLLLAVAIEVNSRLMGIEADTKNFIKQLKQQCEAAGSFYIPGDDFWGILQYMLSDETDNFSDTHLDRVTVNLNDMGRLQLTSKIYNLGGMSSILTLLKVCSLFMPTCQESDESDSTNHTICRLQKSEALPLRYDNKIVIEISQIESEDFERIYQSIKDFIYKQVQIEGNLIHGDSFEIKCNHFLSPARQEHNSIEQLLSSKLEAIVDDATKKYLKLKSPFEIDTEKYIELPIQNAIENFITSDKTGLIAIGSSGSGKTKTVQNFVRKSQNSNTLTIPISAKFYKKKRGSIINLFFGEMLGKSDPENVGELLRGINELLHIKAQCLVLIFDGINEIDYEFEDIISFYTEMIEFAELIHELQLDTIKLVVTCRDHAFFQYERQSGVYPDPRIFYCNDKLEEEDLNPYYRILPLEKEKQREFVKLFFANEEVAYKFQRLLNNNAYMQREFSTPYIIAVAGQIVNETALDHSESFIFVDIFSKFAASMLNKLKNEIQIYTAKKIIHTYIESLLLNKILKRQVTTFFLLDKIDGDKKEALRVLREMQDINIFVANEGINDVNYIRFTHDRIEEYFIGQYLGERSHDELVFARSVQFAATDPIFQGGVLNYFNESIKKQDASFIEKIILLPFDSMVNLPTLVFEALKYVPGAQLNKLLGLKTDSTKKTLELLLNGIEKAITQKSSHVPEDLLPILRDAIQWDEVHWTVDIKYLTALYQMEITNNYKLAEDLCDNLIGEIGNAENTEVSLTFPKIRKLKALLLRNSGKLDVALNEILAIYGYLKSIESWSMATETAMDLGAIYREKTMYEEALNIYNEIDESNTSISGELIIRLYIQKGNVYKNLMQQELKNPELNNEKIISYFNHAMDLFDKALRMQQEQANVIMQIELYTECAETSLKITPLLQEEIKSVAGYLDLAEGLLAYFPFVHRQIQFLRIKAQYIERIGYVIEAVDMLFEALELACNSKLEYRVFECNYIIGSIVLRHVDELPKKTIEKACYALQDAIQFCKKHSLASLVNCKQRLKQLEKVLNKPSYPMHSFTEPLD